MNPINLVPLNCTAWQPPSFLTPQDGPLPNPAFFIEISLHFVALDPEHSYTDILPFWEERKSLTDSAITSWSALSRRLTQLGVPCQFHPIMIQQIVNLARQIASEPGKLTQKTLPIKASLTLIEEREVQFEFIEDDAEAEAQESESEEVRYLEQGGANKISIDKLEKFKLEEGVEIQCAICREEISVGFEATKLPCSHLHVFHADCILKWLRLSSVCPLCRKQVPLD